MVRYVSVFSGIEAASLAAPDGWVPVAFSEIEPFPCAVLAERFPNVPNLGDITKIDWSDLGGTVDVVVGGSPCQSFSVAGNRTGLEGASGLMWEYVRAVRDLRPRAFLWENVPGALSSGSGNDFRCLLEAMDALGYGLAWRVLDAQFFGVAQRRERVFLVGYLGDNGTRMACEVLFEPESLQWDPPSSREKRKAITARAESGAGGAGGFKYHQGSSAGSIGYQHEQSPTLTADWHSPAVSCMTDTQPNTKVDYNLCGTVSSHAKKYPPVVGVTPKTLQVRCGCEGDGKGALVQDNMSATLSVKQTQTVFAPKDVYGIDHVITTGGNCTAQGPCVYDDIEATLKASGPHSVAYAIRADTTPKVSVDECHTLRHGGEGDSLDYVAQPVCVQGNIARGAQMGQNGSGVIEDGTCYTLNTIDRHAVAFAQNTRDEVRLVNGDPT